MEDSKKPENPQAFPSKEIDYRESQIQCRTVYENHHNGMTLRDYFAAKALTIVPFLAKELYGNQGSWEPKDYANEAYKIADAMLKEREK